MMRGALEFWLRLPRLKRLWVALAAWSLTAAAQCAGCYLPAQAYQKEVMSQLAKARMQRADKRAYIKHMGEYEQQLQALQQRIKTATAMLPDKAQVPEFLAQLGARARAAGLVIERFEPKPEAVQDSIAQIPFAVSARGSYHEIGTFIDSLSRLDRIVNVSDFKLLNPRKIGQKVVVQSTFTVRTYRYISDAESTGQKTSR